MNGKKGKKELLEWLKKLMEYAKDNNLSMRIIDGIDDCLKMADMHNSDMEEIKTAIEELLESIGHKAAPSTEKKTEEETRISVEEIREQITGIAQRCQTENAESLQNIGEREKAVIQKAYCELQEITHCEAHISELKSNDKYLGFYEQIKISYEEQAMHLFKEFLNDLANNYQFMIDHIKSMFRSIGGENSGLGSRRFYEEHDIKKENIYRMLETMAQDADCGGSDIGEYGSATRKNVRKIVQKSIWKMRFFILLPILVIFMLLGSGIVKKYVQLENVPDRVTQEQESEGNSELMDEVKNVVEDTVKEGVKKEIAKRGIGGLIKEIYNKIISPLLITAGTVLVFILLLIIVIYAVYIKLMKKMCDRQICKKCSTYLQQEWSKFRQEDPLLQKMDTVLHDLQEEYNRQYLDLLNHLFSKTEYNTSNNSNKDRFEVLKEEWTAIKYG